MDSENQNHQHNSSESNQEISPSQNFTSGEFKMDESASNYSNAEPSQPIAQNSFTPQSQPQAQPQSQPYTQQTVPTDVNPVPISAPKVNFLALLIAFFKKPVTTLKQELPKFTNFKNAGIMAGIVALISTISTVLYTIFLTVIVEDCDYSLFAKTECKTTWKWDNLGKINWLNTVLWSFVGVIATIMIISLVFYAVSRLLKSTKSNYFRIMTIVSLAAFPAIILTAVAPILGKINITLSALIPLIGYAYAGYIVYEGVNNEAGFIDDNRVKFAMLSVIVMVGSVFIMTLAMPKMNLLKYLNLSGSGVPSLKGTGSSSDLDSILKGLGD